MKRRKQQDTAEYIAIGIIIGEGTEDNAGGHNEGGSAGKTAFQAQGEPVQHEGDGQHTAGIRVHIGVQENALGQEGGQKREDPACPPVPEPFPGEQQHNPCHGQSQDQVYGTCGIEHCSWGICKQPCEPHGISLEHIWQNGLEGIGKAIARDSDSFFIAVGQISGFRDITGNQVAVVFIRGIAERLHDQKGNPHSQIQPEITYSDKNMEFTIFFHMENLHLSIPAGNEENSHACMDIKAN